MFNHNNLFSQNYLHHEFCRNVAAEAKEVGTAKKKDGRKKTRKVRSLVQRITFSHPCLSVWDMQKNSEERREYARTCPISQVGKTFGMYLSRLQCGETISLRWNLIKRTDSNWNNFRLHHQRLQCEYMCTDTTNQRKKSQQTYKFLAYSKFEWIGVTCRSSQQRISLSE